LRILRYVITCPTCQRNKPTPQPALKLHPLPVPSKPFQHISLDWLSGFNVDRNGNDSVLNIVDRFNKWAVVIPCSKQMSTPDLIKVLYNRVFSWIGLPGSIIGDRDSRLTASQMRALCKALAIRLKLSVAYHPQTDGSTEVLNKTLLTALRGFSNAYHTNWSKVLPELLYAYHNTIHTSTGFTPHRLLFGWVPRDLRAPLTCPSDSDHADVEEWLRTRSDQLRAAQVKLEHARAAMIKARHSEYMPSYQPGDLVKVSTRVLPLRCSSTQKAKLQPKYIGPFTVQEKLPGGAVRLVMPDCYSTVHNAF
jgi:hypothetical protein